MLRLLALPAMLNFKKVHNALKISQIIITVPFLSKKELFDDSARGINFLFSQNCELIEGLLNLVSLSASTLLKQLAFEETSFTNYKSN